jgi:hypothetical protein
MVLLDKLALLALLDRLEIQANARLDLAIILPVEQAEMQAMLGLLERVVAVDPVEVVA